ncbi:MAG: Acetylglutamate kinase, partial [uncultured Acetobacteraceae bacterium]
ALRHASEPRRHIGTRGNRALRHPGRIAKLGGRHRHGGGGRAGRRHPGRDGHGEPVGAHRPLPRHAADAEERARPAGGARHHRAVPGALAAGVDRNRGGPVPPGPQRADPRDRPPLRLVGRGHRAAGRRGV